MKKLLAVTLACLMLLCAAHAEITAEESAPLTYEELEIYLSSLAKDALASGQAKLISNDSPARVSFLGGTLVIADEQLGENTAVLSAELSREQYDPRGLKIGDTLEELLAAYPNDNPDLMGTYYDAALYVSGEKPEVTAGWLLRDGQRVTQVTHAVYSWQPDGVVCCRVVYGLDQGLITEIAVLGMDSRSSEEEALNEINETAAMQEIREYFAFPVSADGSSLAPFEREDLSFSGIDFLDLTLEMAQEAFGPAPVDEWTQDSTGEYLRLRQWDGISILFVYDASRNFLRVDSLTINDDNVEGPRGVRVGDYMETVLYRFRHGEGGSSENGLILYGDGENAPYGVVAYGDETAAVTYALALDEGNVIWHLTFAASRLQSMRMLLR